MSEMAKEMPLVELLRSVPKDARLQIEDKMSFKSFPIGNYCHRAASVIASKETEKATITDALRVLREWIEASR